jgi:hypothetical protein
MKKINSLIISFAFIVVFIPAVFGQDKVTPPPPGSYKETCQNFKAINDMTLTAQCKVKKCGTLGVCYWDTTLDFFFTCIDSNDGKIGGIANIDGKLCCSRSLDTAQFKAASQAFDTQTEKLAGGIIFFHEDPDVEIQYWIAEYLKNGFGLKAYEGGLNAGMVYSTVTGYIKKNPAIQVKIINQAYQTVFQRDANAVEFAQWLPKVAAGTALYGTIVKEINKQK